MRVLREPKPAQTLEISRIGRVCARNFKTGALNHSATCPLVSMPQKLAIFATTGNCKTVHLCRILCRPGFGTFLLFWSEELQIPFRLADAAVP
jgi:hypothetical protein